jgi:hypothetical protein
MARLKAQPSLMLEVSWPSIRIVDAELFVSEYQKEFPCISY